MSTPGGSIAGARRGSLLLWHLLGAVLVVLVPMMLRFGEPFWSISPSLALQAVVPGFAYLLFGMLSVTRPTTGGLRSAVYAVVAWGACFGACLGLMLVLPDLAYSRVLLAMAFGLGSVLAVGPELLRGGRTFTWALAVVCVATLGVVGWSNLDTSGPVESVEVAHGDPSIVSAGPYTLRITHHSGIGPGPALGGGIGLFRDHLVTSNSLGQLFRVRLTGEGPEVEPLGRPGPVDRAEFIEDNSEAVEDRQFRVVDLLVDTLSEEPRVLLSHYAWNREERCLTIRVSAMGLPGEGAPARGGDSWESVFETRPCVPDVEGGPHLTNHSGGSMAWAPDGALLLTVGDMMYAVVGSRTHPSQDEESDYGKVLLVGPDGSREVVSLGHRNPQGLVVTRDGSVWSTEHGPRGGDELNLLVAGGNYGWPLATYGTDTDQSPMPLAEHHRDHGPYREPVFAWVPSVGIAGLIELRGEAFPDWEGDLLIGSLNGGTLFRTRVRNGSVVYAEPIHIGHRIRDLVETPDGVIVLYTDEGELVTLQRAGSDTGEARFAVLCASCHQPSGPTPATAPDLRGMFGRRAATVPGFDYSPALEGLEIRWDEGTLDAFLTDPQRFVPGTAMRTEGPDAEDRRAIIEYLRTFR